MRWLRIALLIPISLAWSGVSQADGLEPLPKRNERPAQILNGARVQPTRDELAEPELPQRSGWLQHVHIRKGAGFEVRRSIAVNDRAVVLGVKGPVMKRKRLGLAIEVRF